MYPKRCMPRRDQDARCTRPKPSKTRFETVIRSRRSKNVSPPLPQTGIHLRLVPPPHSTLYCCKRMQCRRYCDYKIIIIKLYLISGTTGWKGMHADSFAVNPEWPSKTCFEAQFSQCCSCRNNPLFKAEHAVRRKMSFLQFSIAIKPVFKVVHTVHIRINAAQLFR